MVVNYKTEFPKYDDELKIPKGFKDFSYHNDMMPCVGKRVTFNGNNDLSILIFQDYKDVSKRERDDLPRYHFHIQINGVLIFHQSTDDWSVIEELIRNESINDLK